MGIETVNKYMEEGMAEGLFNPLEYGFAEDFPRNKVLHSVVKVIPKRKLVFDLFASDKERDDWSTGFKADGSGFETMRAGYSKADLEQFSKPEYLNQIVNYEFYELYKQQTKFPAQSYIKGSASGFFLGPNGHIVTNYHIVSGIIEAKGYDREGYVGSKLIPAPSLSIEIVKSLSSHEIIYEKIDEVFLAGCYAKSDAYGKELDLAVLKVNLKPSHFLEPCDAPVSLHQKVYSIGFPMRTARSEQRRDLYNYNDANYDLRVSSGLVVKKEEKNFLTDTDGGLVIAVP